MTLKMRRNQSEKPNSIDIKHMCQILMCFGHCCLRVWSIRGRLCHCRILKGVFLYYRSDSRRKHLKEAFDRMVRFHEDMINALTWLTSAESKVAELDSAVEATSTEEQQDMEALRKELKVGLLLHCIAFF